MSKKTAKTKATKSTKAVQKTAAQKVGPSKAADGQMSCLDAAAKVLAEKKQPMTTAEMIELMASKGYWKSPGGKTPAAMVYSAILRELKKGQGVAIQKDRPRALRAGVDYRIIGRR